jgi:hypothetical protein
MLIMTFVFGCSKDHVAPTFSKFSSFMNQPQNFVASYTKSTDQLNLTLVLSDTNSVSMYYVAWSDSNVFDLGHIANEFTNSVTKSYTLDATKTLKAMGYTAQKDSFIVYFTVSAVYNNVTFNEFIGPRSVVDSALVKRK